METKGEKSISANEKLLDLLLLFRDEPGSITIDDISAWLDIPRSTVYRYTRTLTDRGFLDKGVRAGTYRLGRAFYELSRASLATDRALHLAALPTLTAIASETGESVSLMRLLNRRAVCIESIEGQHALRVAIERGRSQQLHAGASSKVLLAFQPEGDWRDLLDFPLARYTPTTHTDWAVLEAELYAVRDGGYAVSDGEIDIGARAVAVPVWNGDVVAAALSIEAPSSRMPDDRVAACLPLLKSGAATIRAALAGAGAAPQPNLNSKL